MVCLDCGSSWREFGASSPSKSERLVADCSTPIAISAPVELPKADNLSASFDALKSGSNNPIGLGTMVSGLAAALFVAGLYVGVTFLREGVQPVFNKQLQIAEVSMDEQVRRGGEKVFTVKGMVSNPGEKHKHIPKIEIVLRKQNGAEIVRWYHNSALSSLAPGGRVRFASSIQYDTPVAAYAEANFNK